MAYGLWGRLATQRFVYPSLSHCRFFTVARYNVSVSTADEYLRKVNVSKLQEPLTTNVAIVGGGPAGLAAGIRLKQLLGESADVMLFEKAATPGGHTVSGNIFDPKALDELLPDWRLCFQETHPLLSPGFPFRTRVTQEDFKILMTSAFGLACPDMLRRLSIDSTGCFVVSLCEVVRWLTRIAESLGVNVVHGAAVSHLLTDENGKGNVIGLTLRDTGLTSQGNRGPHYEKGLDVQCNHIILAEGACGSLSEFVKHHYQLQGASSPQRYGLGLKEVWEVSPDCHKPGYVLHTVGWPLRYHETGGAFCYHMLGENSQPLVHLGLIVDLKYADPNLNCYEEFQKFKTHPVVRGLLSHPKSKRLEYGARVMTQGGYQAIPESLDFPGAGCSAGFMNVAKIKGTHTAMKSGMIAAEVIARQLQGKPTCSYTEAVRSSWINKELWKTRNVKPPFSWPGKLYTGLFSAFLHSVLTRGHEPWTSWWASTDNEMTGQPGAFKKRVYPKHDDIINFDISTSLALASIAHYGSQPSHLKIKKNLLHMAEGDSWRYYGAPESSFCPAQVYEYVSAPPKLTLHPQNCVHCKACAIKSPQQYIQWTVPEGGGGPSYQFL